MATSRSIGAPLAAARHDPTWRARAGVALALVFGGPDLWVIGALSVVARGGLLVLTLPILTLPSPVGVGIMLGPQVVQLGESAIPSLLAGGLLVAGVIVLLGLVCSAVADVMAYERFVTDPETLELRSGRAPRAQTARRRSATVLSLATVHGTVLVPAALAAALLLERAAFVLRDELIRPSSGVPLLARLIESTRAQLLALVVGVVIAEVVGSVASRRLLAWRYGMAASRGVPSAGTRQRGRGQMHLHLLGASVDVIARAAVGWLVTCALVAPGAAALVVVWDQVRRLYLGTGGPSPELALERVALTIVFAAAWVTVIVLAGLASAIRAALWSAGSLR